MFMKHIFYISQFNLTSHRAHTHNVLKTCEALNRESGGGITFITTNNLLGREDVDKIFEMHNIGKPFKVIILNSLSNFFRNRTKIWLYLGVFLANISLIKFLYQNRNNFEVLYWRDHLLFLAAIFGKYLLGKKSFFESHYTLDNFFDQRLVNLSIRTADGVIAITDGLKKYYERLNKNIIVSYCSASEPENFSYDRTQKDLREELNLPCDKIVLGYTGTFSRSIQGNYTVDKVIHALKFLPENVIFVGVGERNDDALPLKNLARELGVEKRTIFVPWLPRREVLKYLLSFDVLIIPSAGKRPGDFPGKTFDYLLAKKPIIASAVGPVTEILRDKINALLVYPDNPEEWSVKIKEALQDANLRDRITSIALEDAKKYTWEGRGKTICNFIKSLTNSKTQNV